MLYGMIVLILVFDQLTKFIAVNYLKDRPAIIIIEDVLQFVYVENYGAAFGMLQNKRPLFIIITLLVIIGIAFFLSINYYHITKLMRISLAMLVAGALGNLIDRVRLGYVIDFISVRFGTGYNFPVFNVADSFIVIATILIIYMVIFNKYEM